MGVDKLKCNFRCPTKRHLAVIHDLIIKTDIARNRIHICLIHARLLFLQRSNPFLQSFYGCTMHHTLFALFIIPCISILYFLCFHPCYRRLLLLVLMRFAQESSLDVCIGFPMWIPIIWVIRRHYTCTDTCHDKLAYIYTSSSFLTATKHQ